MSPSPLDYKPCAVPLRRAIGVFGGISMTVHAGIYEDVLEADRRWKANGGNSLFDVRQGDTGSYSCRNSVAHSRAVAIDFNWSSNGMTSKRTPCPGDMPAAFYELCWKPLGYGWGANWRSKCDRMHISKLVSEGGDGALYRKWDDEEDDMFTEDDRKDLDAIKRTLGVGQDYAQGTNVLALLVEKRGEKFVEASDEIRELVLKAVADAKAEILAAIAGG